LFKIVLIFIIIILVFVGLLNSTWFLKFFYPEPHKEIIEEASQKHEIDVHLIFAVIKVESKFNKKALSNKGARGLMQILPETAQWVAKELDYKNFNADLLYEPKYNINIGTWYLKYLVKQFNGNTIAALAAYNGGETNVKKWLNQGTWSGSLDELDNIPFKETRNYIYKVILDYKTYQDLYGGK